MNDKAAWGTWRFAAAELDVRARELRVHGQAVAIEPKPFELLVLLLEHAGELVTGDEILEAVWTGRIVNEATVANTISKIRKVLGDDDQAIIRTIPKAGYRLVAPVERLVSVRQAPEFPELVVGGTVPGRAQWRLVEHLGGGGYGEAWLAVHGKTAEKRVFKFCLQAERLSTLKREVTLNRLLRQSLGDRDDFVHIQEWNFEQAPYYIESDYAGQNLCRWVEGRGGFAAVPLEDRLEIFARAATAVAVAHSVGVLHKDIKPENILVAEEAGSPLSASPSQARRVVSLCDFGVGRLIEAARLSELGITRAGFTRTIEADPSTSGTLLYLAPELLSRGVPSVQSDVYALGVLLYQMMIGEFGRPLAQGWESGIEDELIRQDILDATHGDSSRRLPSVQILVDRLQGLPARRKELERRKAERQRAEAAYLALERTRARRPWLIAAVTVLLVGLAAVSLLWGRARHDARLAQALNEFISADVLRAEDLHSYYSDHLLLKTALLRAVPLVAERFDGDPEMQAAMYNTLGRALNRLYDTRDAFDQDQRAVQLDSRLYGEDDARTLAAQVDLANDDLQMRKYAEGLALLSAILPRLQASLAESSETVLFARAIRARLSCMGASYCPDSLPVYGQLIADVQNTHARDTFLRSLQWSYCDQLIRVGRAADAEQYLRKLMPDIDKQYGARIPRAVEMMSLLARSVAAQHRLSEAEGLYHDAIARTDNWGSQGEKKATFIERDLADLYELEGRWSEADALLQRGYDGILAEYNLVTARRLLGAPLALAKVELGQAQDALALARYTAEILAMNPEGNEEALMQCQLAEALALIGLQRVEEAGPVVGQLSALVAKPAYRNDLYWQSQMAELQSRLAQAIGNLPLARDDAQRALTMLNQAWGNDDASTHEAATLLKSL